ncbi:hypothetical protein [Flagellimonas oceanensis]|uniref:hypothetical protein n=1 Tax=Flagellimonas oceanensis TaxID=2499163 RepID=UPI000F8F5B4F|nr:hypothetical protein [Allomuricauda oceanensis]
MKKIILLLSINLIVISSLSAQYSLDEPKKLGFIAYLNTIKEISENKILWSEARYIQREIDRKDSLKKIEDDIKKKELLLEQSSDTRSLENELNNLNNQHKPWKEIWSKQKESDIKIRQEIQNKYANLRWKTNLLINQFSSDIVNLNRISIYRDMDNYLKNGGVLPKKLKKFKPLLEEIENKYNKLLSSKYRTGGPQSVAGLQELFTLAGISPYTIYKDIKASKEKKITTLVGFIKEMRLKTLSELQSGSKEEDKEEEMEKSEK